MQCNFCSKKINIKTEWHKKPIWEKSMDVANYSAGNISFGSEGDMLDKLPFFKSLFTIGGEIFSVIVEFLLLFTSICFLAAPILSIFRVFVYLNFYDSIISILIGIIAGILFIVCAYFRFVLNLERNFKWIYNFNSTSSKCPHCGKNNKLKIRTDYI